FFFQAEDGIRDFHVTGVQTCALPIWCLHGSRWSRWSAVHHRYFMGTYFSSCRSIEDGSKDQCGGTGFRRREKTYQPWSETTYSEIGSASCMESGEMEGDELRVPQTVV